MQLHKISRWSRDIELPWCGRARRPCAGRRRARDRRAAPTNDITLHTALVHAPPSHSASQSMEAHRTSRCSRDMKIPWCARARDHRAGRRRARDHRAGRRRARDHRAGSRRSRDRRAARTNDITLDTALVHAPPSHRASQTMVVCRCVGVCMPHRACMSPQRA
jgi:hypothetical protein